MKKHLSFRAAFIRVPFGSMTLTMPASNNTAARRYLDLLRHALCRDRFPDARYDMRSGSLKLMLFEPALRAQGGDWPLEAVTMVGTKCLENLENCCSTALAEGIPGDFVETGVWRGGCGILMRAILAATGDEIRDFGCLIFLPGCLSQM